MSSWSRLLTEVPAILHLTVVVGFLEKDNILV
jgi:hypothetical protein